MISYKQCKTLYKQGSELFLIDLKNLNAPEESKTNRVPSELQETLELFSDVFPDEPPGRTPGDRPEARLQIDTGDHKPVTGPLYRMSPLKLDTLRKQLKDMVDKNMIRPSNYPWSSPVLFVRKKDGTLRMCVDYRALNALTTKDNYPLPRIDESFNRLGQATIFSKIDLRSGYWQVRIEPDDVPKTAFNTRYGQHESLVMPFGLTNAPAAFQTLMNQILRPWLDNFVLVYLDDILIYSQNMEEHIIHVKKVLNALRENELYANPSKSEFGLTELEYVAHILGKEGIKVNPKKITAIQEWPKPTTVTAMRSFVGMTSYYRRFIRDYAKIASPLTDTTKGSPKKREVVEWNEIRESAFTTLKETLMTGPVLKPFNPELPSVIETDASDYAVGAHWYNKAKGNPFNQ